MPRARVEVPLRWSDMDAYGHVNNVEFVRLLEEARIRALDGGGTSMLATGLVVAAQRMEYLRPLVHRIEPLVIEVWVSRLRPSDFDFGYRIHDGDALCAQAESTMVPFDLAAQRPRRLGPAELDLLGRWRDEPITWRRFGASRESPATGS